MLPPKLLLDKISSCSLESSPNEGGCCHLDCYDTGEVQLKEQGFLVKLGYRHCVHYYTVKEVRFPMVGGMPPLSLLLDMDR